MAVKRKTQKTVEKGRVYVTATFNNTIVTITDKEGNTLCWGSSGSVGFKNARKATPFAAMKAVDSACRKASSFGLREIEVFIKGPGSGRDAALRALRATGFRITMIADVTPMPHNGVRPKKRRRV